MATLQKPPRVYPTLNSFRLRCVFNPRPSINWPCLRCGARGYYYKPEDRCPVEGFKDAPRYRCEACNGTGEGSKEAVRAAYQKWLADYKVKLAEWRRVDKIRRGALKKLTREEKKVLGLM